MKRYYGATIAEPQGVRIKDNSTGVWGFPKNGVLVIFNDSAPLMWRLPGDVDVPCY